MLWQTAEGDVYRREIGLSLWSSHKLAPVWHRGNILIHHLGELGLLLSCGVYGSAGCSINLFNNGASCWREASEGSYLAALVGPTDWPQCMCGVGWDLIV